MKNIVIRFLSNLKRIKNLILLGTGLLKSTYIYADLGMLPDGITDELRKQEGHVIHIVPINPSLYQMAFVKSHDQVFGRETLPEIALRKGALVAFNAGFFEIGGSEDGRPKCY
jgi:hypothetical protein